MSEHYNKQFLTIPEQIQLLRSRGLSFNDDYAIKYLNRISFFRIKSYLYPLLKTPKEHNIFKSDAKLETAIDLYKFDRKLRLLLFSQLEKIEISFRLFIVEKGFQATNDIKWISNPDNFKDETQFKNTRDLIYKEWKSSKEDFVDEFKQKYGNEEVPPSYMLLELAPLGVVAHLFRNIKKSSLKKSIAKEFGLPFDVLASWMFCLSGIRNICCHHNRLWNRLLPNIPMPLNNPKADWIKTHGIDYRRTYYKLAMVEYMLEFINPSNRFLSGLLMLKNEYPLVDFSAMGFPANWQDEPLWNK